MIGTSKYMSALCWNERRNATAFQDFKSNSLIFSLFSSHFCISISEAAEDMLIDRAGCQCSWLCRLSVFLQLENKFSDFYKNISQEEYSSIHRHAFSLLCYLAVRFYMRKCSPEWRTWSARQGRGHRQASRDFVLCCNFVLCAWHCESCLWEVVPSLILTCGCCR